MLKEEFEALIELLDAKKVRTVPNVHELLLRVFNFFKSVNEEFAVASKEEQGELVMMLSSLQKKLQSKLQEFSSDLGLSEDQIQRFSQDFATLPSKYKEAILATQREMEQVRSHIKQHISQKQQTTPSPIGDKEPAKEGKKKPKRDRGKWKKS